MEIYGRGLLRTMKLQLIRYICADCDTSFESPGSSENSYGEFILRSRSGEIAYLNALVDKTYDEVDEIISALSPGTPPFARVQRLQLVYGAAACDRDSRGFPFVIGAKPPCPKCSSQQMASWTFLGPEKQVEIEVPAVAHLLWSSLSNDQKIRRVVDG